MSDVADEPSSLLDWATGLATDPVLRARFGEEPRTVLDEQGFAQVAPADLHHSLPLVTDTVAARLGTEVPLVESVAQLDGEDPVTALARHLGTATETVLGGNDPTTHDDDVEHPAGSPAGPVDLDGPMTPDDDVDPSDPTPDHPHPREHTMSTSPANAAAAHGFSEQDWSRVEARAEKFGYGHDVDRFLEVADNSDDRFTALFGDGMGDQYWRDNPGSMHGAGVRDPAVGADHDLDGFGGPGPEPGGSALPGDDPFSESPGPGHTASPAGADTDLDDLDDVGPGATGGDHWTPQPEDPFLGWPEEHRSGVPTAGGDDHDFGASSHVGGTGGGESFHSFGAGGDPVIDPPAPVDDLPVETTSGSDHTGLDDVGGHDPSSTDTSHEFSHEDSGAHDVADHGDPGAHDAGGDSSDYSESFG